MAKSAALNTTPYRIAGAEYWIKPHYGGNGKMYAYKKGAGQRGKIALGVAHNSKDPEGCLSACLVALREHFDVSDTDFANRRFDFTHIREPLPPSELRLWQLIAFHRDYTVKHTKSKYVARHIILDHALHQWLGEKYEAMPVSKLNDERMHELAGFLANKYKPKQAAKLSPSTVWHTIATLKGCMSFGVNTKPKMGLRDEDDEAISLITSRPVHDFGANEFRKVTGVSAKTKTIQREYWSPSDTAVLLDALHRRKSTVRGPNAAQPLINWVIVAISCPARCGQLMAINWHPRESPHIVRNLYVGSSDWAIKVPDSSWNKRGGVVRVCDTLKAYLSEWKDEAPVPVGKDPVQVSLVMNRAFGRLMKSIDLNLHLTARTWRYVMTSWLLGQGISDGEIGAMCGWAPSSGNDMVDVYDEQMVRPDTGLRGAQAIQAYWNEVARELKEIESDFELKGVSE